MAHFAKLGINGKVISVLTLKNSDMLNASQIEDETVGQEYLERHNNWPSQLWIQTSYNTKGGIYYNQDGTEGDQSKAFRGNYAGIGSTWDEDNKIFWPIKPHNSWVKNIATASWKSPIGDAPELTEEQKTDKSFYNWNEDTLSWDLVITSL